MMIVIKTDNGHNYWTKTYTEQNGFFVFKSTSKQGTERNIRLNKDKVIEIAEIAQDFNDKSGRK